MSNSDFTLTVLGTRGSMAVYGDEYIEFGGSTSCYLVQAGQKTVLLDAGSGLLKAPVSFPTPPVILLSHWHLDHLQGLGMYGRLSQAGMYTQLYAPAASKENVLKSLNALYTPPYWPLELSGYAGDLDVDVVPKTLDLGPLTVETIEGNHPGGCLAFRLSYEGKVIVYATDYEHEPVSFARLTDFARDANLLLYDGQYSEEDYESHKGFGHSTAQKGIELMKASNAQRLLIVHHDPQSTDTELLQRERRIGRTDVSFAREGEMIAL
ncbi:MAG: MBL fold metallo-hydrolase [Atopobiaceae bacterium]|nr:MBL fold metallo-hydrolase [Atopobiaceae bacterium]MDO4405255.1 MBL fold metallo-hydrolase [Atopobiaceae bacterium]